MDKRKEDGFNINSDGMSFDFEKKESYLFEDVKPFIKDESILSTQGTYAIYMNDHKGLKCKVGYTDKPEHAKIIQELIDQHL